MKTNKTEFIAQLIDEVTVITPELSKRGINYDHIQIKKLLETAYLYDVLTQILVELKFANQQEMLKKLPASMFNLDQG